MPISPYKETFPVPVLVCRESFMKSVLRIIVIVAEPNSAKQ